MLVCFGAISHAAVRMDRVLDSGPSNKPVSTQVNDTRARDLSECKSGSKGGDQPLALTLEQRKNDLVFLALS